MVKYLSVLIVCLSMVGCNSCVGSSDRVENPPVYPSPSQSTHKPEPVPQPPPDPKPMNVALSGADWVFNAKANLEKMESSDKDLQFTLESKEEKRIVYLVREDYKYSMNAYALSSLRSLKQSGVVLEESQSVFNKDVPFVKVTVSKDDKQQFIWMTVKEAQDIAFGFGCVGFKTDEDLTDFCQNMFNGLEISNG